MGYTGKVLANQNSEGSQNSVEGSFRPYFDLYFVWTSKSTKSECNCRCTFYIVFQYIICSDYQIYIWTERLKWFLTQISSPFHVTDLKGNSEPYMSGFTISHNSNTKEVLPPLPPPPPPPLKQTDPTGPTQDSPCTTPTSIFGWSDLLQVLLILAAFPFVIPCYIYGLHPFSGFFMFPLTRTSQSKN